VIKNDLQNNLTGGKRMKRQATASLIKIFTTPFAYEKVIYQGTLRGCKKRIKPSQKDRFRIDFKK